MREELKPLRLAVAASFAGGEVPDEALLARIDEELTAYGRAKRLSIEEKTACRKELFDSFRGMDILQKALDDESVTEIMVNGLEGIWLEKGSEIIVENTGANFDPVAGNNEPHIALNNIRERLDMMCGGKLTITTREEGGTSVKVTIPAAKEFDFA